MITDVAVVVPAHDEEQEIAACLTGLARSIHHARTRFGPGVRVRLCVVLDDCRDSTAEVVRAFGGSELLTISQRNVGAARGTGVRHLLAALHTHPAQVWVASSDADSVVPVSWIAEMVHLADEGADLVLGTVIPAGGLSDQVETAWRARQRLRDGHGHVHGANLGIRASAYLALGGWPALTTGEDVALAERAVRAGHLQVARTARVPVLTSSRLTGRAGGGFAGYLRELHALAEAG